MKREQVARKLTAVIVDQLGFDSEEELIQDGIMKPEVNFLDDLGLDSLDVVELILAAEEAFDIEISDEDAEKICIPDGATEKTGTVGDAVNYLCERLGVT